MRSSYYRPLSLSLLPVRLVHRRGTVCCQPDGPSAIFWAALVPFPSCRCGGARVQVWGGPLSGGRVVLALVNRGHKGTHEITANWLNLPLLAGTTVSAYDVWEHKEIEGTFTDSYTWTVGPRDLHMVILTPLNGSMATLPRKKLEVENKVEVLQRL
eukprot:TRINITY_DN169_c0_g1_i13.p1 TRINITY_DN169_c0_g1~~TRINITY_DN169_c0_g1_i13.p1  ORF type:complete len:156 (-),score=25.08 TRINITY_DN169_c0_g1_i13:896-1363(-)